MINELNIDIPAELIDLALKELPSFDFRLTINHPTGNFFYDPWEVKEEFKNTVWGKLIVTLPYSVGEARIVSLASKQCYASHADIDNRWHLALTNDNSFLIDLENLKMHPCEIGKWYSMEASLMHTAANFGASDRVHLLVRQLLKNAELKNPVEYFIEFNKDFQVPHRYIFDKVYSPILNNLNTRNLLAEFNRTETSVTFKTEDIIEIPHNNYFIITRL
jgi:hypothetical protein